jgi:hypothetical protein
MLPTHKTLGFRALRHLVFVLLAPCYMSVGFSAEIILEPVERPGEPGIIERILPESLKEEPIDSVVARLTERLRSTEKQQVMEAEQKKSLLQVSKTSKAEIESHFPRLEHAEIYLDEPTINLPGMTETHVRRFANLPPKNSGVIPSHMDFNYQFGNPDRNSLDSSKLTGYSFIDITSSAYNGRYDAKTFFFLDRNKLQNEENQAVFSTHPSKLVIASPGGIKAVKEYVSTPIARTEILFIVPTDDDGVKNMFGTANPDFSFHFNTAKAILEPLPNVKFIEREIHPSSIPSEKQMKDALIDRINQIILSNPLSINGKTLILIVGHNENGELKFPDGSSVAIDHLYSFADCLTVISCETIQHLPENLTGIASVVPLDAVDVAHALVQAELGTYGRKATYLGDYYHMLECGLNGADNARLNHAKIILGLVGTGVTVGVVVPVVFANNDDKTKQKQK